MLLQTQEAEEEEEALPQHLLEGAGEAGEVVEAGAGEVHLLVEVVAGEGEDLRLGPWPCGACPVLSVS